jgi:four helix bundle protein
MTKGIVVTEQPERAETPKDAKKKSYDLEERTARFGEAVIAFAKRVPHNVVTIPLIGQLVRASTSVGANYCEADDSVSKKESRHKIGICKKESRESKYWLRMIAAAEDNTKQQGRVLWQEAKELHLIFCSIWRKK